MGTIFIRALILYFVVIFSVRLMGKRQLGELQPSELVITILISNIATLPLEDTAIPLLPGILPILSMVCFEVIISWFSLKSRRLRRVICGSPKIIIRNGQIEQDTMRELRLSIDDLMTALRGNQVFATQNHRPPCYADFRRKTQPKCPAQPAKRTQLGCCGTATAKTTGKRCLSVDR